MNWESFLRGVRVESSSALVVRTVLVGVITIPGIYIIRYWKSVRKQLKALQESAFFGKSADPFRMVRCETNLNATAVVPNASIGLIELNPEFCQIHNKVRMVSLGDYLSNLRPHLAHQMLPEFVEKEIQNAMAAALIRELGPQFGAAVLPGMGTGIVQGFVHRIASMVSSHMLALSSSGSDVDRGAVKLSLNVITSSAELNYDQDKRRRAATDTDGPPSPLDLLRLGEVGYGKLSFDPVEIVDEPDDIFPDPFIVSKHWDLTIGSMEQRIASMEASSGVPIETRYDPESKALPPPKPIDERLLPDLHLGFGAAECTHTKRQVLKNRLFAVLLNKLASNYHAYEGDDDNTGTRTNKLPPFVLRMDPASQEITKPDDFLHALVAMGHSVEACVRTNITTFGVALCVKEPNDTWTNIPLAYFLENGFVAANGDVAYEALPHSGLNMEVRGGPLLEHASLQHYLAIEGLCAWHSNHNASVPWLQNVDCSRVMVGAEEVAECVRVAAMQAIVLNTLATEQRLPHGGYGLSGVCNDTAAMAEYALTGTTHVYPLTLNGKFAMYNIRVAKELRKTLKREQDIKAIDGFISAFRNLPSDTNSLPCEANDQCRRMLHCQPERIAFSLMLESREIMRSIQQELVE